MDGPAVREPTTTFCTSPFLCISCHCAYTFAQKDVAVAAELQATIMEKAGTLRTPQTPTQRVHLPRWTSFKPDSVVSLQDTVALFDSTYAKYSHVFRILQPSGRQVLFRAKDEESLNGWMSTINYSASFRTAGIRMRGLPLPDETHRQRFNSDEVSRRDSTSKGASLGDEPSTRAPEAMLSRQSERSERVDEAFVFNKNTTSELARGDTIRPSANSRCDIIKVGMHVLAEKAG